MQKINLAERFDRITEHWRPKIVAELNGQVVRLVKVLGEFVWHRHEQEDELFYVVRGQLRIDFRDGPVTFEPAGVRNTGDVEHPTLTAPQDARL